MSIKNKNISKCMNIFNFVQHMFLMMNFKGHFTHKMIQAWNLILAFFAYSLWKLGLTFHWRNKLLKENTFPIESVEYHSSMREDIPQDASRVSFFKI